MIAGTVPIGLFVLLASGLCFLIGGKRILKPLIILGGLTFGAATGLGLQAVPPMAGIAPIWPIIVGAAVGGLIALLAYRLFLGAAMALVLGMVAPTTFFLWAQHGHNPIRSPVEVVAPDAQANSTSAPWAVEFQRGVDQSVGAIDLFAQRLAEEAYRHDLSMSDPATTKLDSGAEDTSGSSMTNLLRDARGWAQRGARSWQAAAPATKSWTILVGLLGMVVGFISGVLMPDFLAALLTATGGAAAAIVSGLALAERFAVPLQSVGANHPEMVALFWALAALAGLAYQLSETKKPARTIQHAAELDANRRAATA